MKKISKNMLFNVLLVSFLVWVFLNNYFLEFKLSLIILLLISIFLINFIIYFKKKTIYFIYLILFLVWFIFWVFISNINIESIENNINKIKHYDNGFNNTIKVEILNVYKIKDFHNEYIAKLLEVNYEEIYNIEVLWIIKIPKNYEIEKGDIIKSKAKFNLIKDFNEFEYEKFMFSKWIYFKSYFPFVERVSKVEISLLIQKIDSLRVEFLRIIYEIYPKNEAIFLAWILLWARESLPPELKTNFNNSWLTHFIAVSGFNITILILFFSFILKGLPIIIRTILITTLIVFFVLLVWDTAPVIRASIMGLIAYYILVSGRKWDIFTILVFTAFVMVLISPFTLNYDVSFHLSFLAVFGLVYAQDFWKRIFKFMPETLAIREAFVLTLSALTFTIPIMLLNFGQVSVLSPFANVAVTWTIPIAMLLWFLSIIAYLIFPIFGYIIWYVTWIFLKWDMLVVDFFWSNTYSIVKYDFGIYKNYIEVLYFIIILFIVLYFGWKKVKEIDKINLIKK